MFAQPIDRNVCPFLSLYDFMSFRKTCRVHYMDQDAYKQRAAALPFKTDDLSARKNIALNYLFAWSLHFDERIGSQSWYQCIIDWLKYKSSIKLMSTFIRKRNIDFLPMFTFDKLDSGRQFMWFRQFGNISTGRTLYKADHLDNYGGRPRKRYKRWRPNFRDVQSCFA